MIAECARHTIGLQVRLQHIAALTLSTMLHIKDRFWTSLHLVKCEWSREAATNG